MSIIEKLFLEPCESPRNENKYIFINSWHQGTKEKNELCSDAEMKTIQDIFLEQKSWIYDKKIQPITFQLKWQNLIS